jgi:small subunit ribosomal protein S2
MDNMLTKQEQYLESGIHIGTKVRLANMDQFIYRMRNDGLYVLDLRKIDDRIRLAGKLLSHYEPSDVLVVASRMYSSSAAAKFCEVTGCRLIGGRFIPGVFTNVARDDFTEPKLIIVSDPKGERQAVHEAGKMGIPIIGLCDTDNSTSYIDWILPCNNKGRRSLALIFYLLAREMEIGKGKIPSADKFAAKLEEFEAAQEEAGGREGEEPEERGEKNEEERKEKRTEENKEEKERKKGAKEEEP